MNRFAAALIFLAALAAPSAPFVQPAHAIEPPVLRVSLEAEPASLDWNRGNSGPTRFIVSFLMRGLLKYASGSTTPVCDLCKSFTTSEDGKTLTFEINTEETWSDGQKLEAQQFVDSFRRLLSPTLHFQAAEPFKVIAGATNSGRLAVSAEGKSRLTIALSHPSPMFLHLLTTSPAFPIRKEFLKDNAQESGEVHVSSAVLGPYQLAAWERGKRIVIEGNPCYVGPRPVYRVDFVLGKHETHLASFKKGKLDILTGATMEDLLGMPGQKVRVDPYWATRTLMFNAKRKLLSEVGFRRAILYALDREGLPAFLKNGERKVTGLIPPGLPGHRDLPLVTRDLSRARAERERVVAKGQAVELKLLFPEGMVHSQIASWLTSQLGALEIRVKGVAKPLPAYQKALESGDFDLALGTLDFDMAHPGPVFGAFGSGARDNYGKWANVGYDHLLEELDREARPEAMASILDRASQMLEAQEAVLIPLGYPSSPFLLGRRVANFAITPFGDPDLVRIQLQLGPAK